MAKKNKKQSEKPKGTFKPLTDDPLTPQQQCEKSHSGQSGYCDKNGGWHPSL